VRRCTAGSPAPDCRAARRQRRREYFSLAPYLRGEGWGKGFLRERLHQLMDLYPLTRILRFA
jgi:hypothetical protein